MLTVTKMIAEAHIRAEERAKAAHERFNVFTTLLGENDEVRLHTRFLHCLLDPKGCHDCGSLFLDIFLAMLKENPGLNDSDELIPVEIPEVDEEWSIGKEVPCPPHGQIDLLIKRARFKIAIENKINAGEQNRQLAGYYEFLRKRPADTAWLFYLTKDGKKSVTHEGAPYVRISYANHILPWLEECLRESYRMVPINQGLLQYLEVVRQITGKTLQSTAMKPIAEIITQYPDLFRYRKQIQKATDMACANFFDRLANGIQKELQGEFNVRPHPHQRFGVHKYGTIILTTERFPFEIWIEYAMSETFVAFGIAGHFDTNPLSDDQSKLFKRMDELLIADAGANGIEKPDANGNWPTGWAYLIKDITDESLADLMLEPIHKTASRICEKIRKYFALLEQIYVEAKSVPTA